MCGGHGQKEVKLRRGGLRLREQLQSEWDEKSAELNALLQGG